MKDFKQKLYEALLVAFGKVLSKYNTFAQGSILRDVGKEIIDYLTKNGFEFKEKGNLDDLSTLTELFVKNGFSERLEIMPADKGQNYVWHNLYGIEAYQEIHKITDNPFLACPLNLCLYYLADKHNKTMRLHSKSFDMKNKMVQSQYELVDKDISGGEQFDALVIENVRLYELAQERAEKLEKAQLIHKRMEVALRESEKRFRDVAENAQEWVWEVDAEGKYTYVSPIVERLLGYKPEEVLNKHFYDFFLPEEREELKKMAFAAFAAKQPIREFINRNLHKDGRIVWLSTSGVPILDKTGNLLGYRGADINITARKKAEDALRDSEQNYRLLVNQIPAVVFKGYADWRVDFFDQKVEAVTGYSKEDFDSRKLKWSDLMLPEDLPEAKAKFIEALKGDRSYLREYRIRKKTGDIRWIQGLGKIFCDAGGEIDYVNGIFFDITARKQAEEALEEEAIRRRILVEQSRDGIVVLDQTGKVYEANRRYAEMLGYSAEEVRQLYVWDWDTQWTREELLEKIRLVTPVGDHFETRHRRKDGTFLDVEISTNGAVLGGQKLVFCVCRDFSLRKRAEEALQKSNEQLQTMVAEANRRNQEITLINQMSELLQTCLSINETYSIITRFAPELFPALSGGFFMLDQDKNLLEAVSLWGGPLGSASVFAPDDCRGIQRGRAHLVKGDGQGMQCRHLHEAASPNYLCLPLIAQGETLGMLHFQGLRELIAGETDWLQRRAETVADHVALALTNIRLRETLQYQAIHDPLTGLFNRRYLDETMVREIHRVRRKGAPLGVIMLDLDHFKPFNDTFGHEAGDNLLHALGEFLLIQVRQEDVACRYGGEEFVLILPEASLDVVKARAEEIREKVPQLQVLHRGQLLESITLSLGVAMFPDHGATGEDVLRAADDAMYQAKRGGRNRVVVAESGKASNNPS